MFLHFLNDRMSMSVCAFLRRMIVGAPRDNITSAKLMAKGVERPGTVYRCDINQGSKCQPIIVDKGETSLVLKVCHLSLILCICIHFRLYLYCVGGSS